MTDDQLRELGSKHWFMVIMPLPRVFYEIAAQLAEINANLRDLAYAVRGTGDSHENLRNNDTPRRWR